MTITAENVLAHEIVGLYGTIRESSDSTICGISGRILSETKNMIFIAVSSSKVVKVAKKVATRIELATESGVCFISGTSLIGRPEDRIARLN